MHKTTIARRLNQLARNRPGAVVSALAVLQMGAIAPAWAHPLAGEFSGDASAAFSNAIVGPLAVKLGSSARESCPCRGTKGVTHTRTLSSLSVGPGGSILSAATSVSTSFGGKTATSASTRQSSTISGISLLGGLITGDTIEAVASVDASPDTITPSADGSKFVNLIVAGTKIDPNVAPDTVIQLAGIGSVTLKHEQLRGGGKNGGKVLVQMLRIDVLSTNSFGLPVGAAIVVGGAEAGFNREQPPSALAGGASGVRLSGDAGSLLQETVGHGASVGIGDCAGTDGAVRTKSVTAINVPNILSIGTETTTAFGGPMGSGTVAKTTAVVENTSFLGGLVTATTITAVAQDSRVGNVSTPSTAGSGFAGLTIAGIPIKTNTPPNTTVPLPGVGYVVVNEQLTPGPGVAVVNGLHVVVDTTNLLGLPVGTDLVLAHAGASDKRF